jgi:hypothetical protein
MKVIVYGDFNCPYSYLASQRSARLARDGMTEIDWRAVEHDPKLAMTGTPADHAVWDKELAEVAAPPPVISNTRAAVAAYAEAVSDGIAGELRRRLFGAIWGQKRHLSSAYEVRRLVTRLMWRPGCITDRLASPDLPGLLDRDPDLTRIVRRSGGTIAPDGGPLTTVGWLRIRRWREGWLALPSQVIPAVIGPDRIMRSGIEGLRYLADLDATMAAASQLPDPRARPDPVRLPVRTA